MRAARPAARAVEIEQEAPPGALSEPVTGQWRAPPGALSGLAAGQWRAPPASLAGLVAGQWRAPPASLAGLVAGQQAVRPRAPSGLVAGQRVAPLGAPEAGQRGAPRAAPAAGQQAGRLGTPEAERPGERPPGESRLYVAIRRELERARRAARAPPLAGAAGGSGRVDPSRSAALGRARTCRRPRGRNPASEAKHDATQPLGLLP
jgi:hypothetical protein